MPRDSAFVVGPASSVGQARRSPKAWPTVRANEIAAAGAVITALAAALCLIGADARWLSALGDVILRRRSIPSGVPFATASAVHWHNPVVLAELIFHLVQSGMGDRGLMLAQLLAVAGGVSLLARDARAGGASSGQTAGALLVAGVGMLPSLAIVRVQLFSIVLFPLLISLLRAEQRRPSRRIWAVVPLLAVWSNLHGAALVGLAATILYLALARLRGDPRTAIAVGMIAALAICLTPAGLHTIDYYHGVLSNQAAARGEGLWKPLSPTAPLDIVLIFAALALGWRLVRSRPPVWELAAAVLLTALTAQAGRSGVWLLLFLAAPAARRFRSNRFWVRLLAPLGTLGVVVLALAVVRGPLPTGADHAVLARAIALAHGTPILAEDVEGEQVAQAGGHVWVTNPIDAFSRRDQNTYLDWLEGRATGVGALAHGELVVLTALHSRAQRMMARRADFAIVDADRHVDVFVRRGP